MSKIFIDKISDGPTTPKPFKRQVTQILTPDGPVPVLIGKIEPILYDELCVMANWLMENSDNKDAIESSTQTYQMWIEFGSERFSKFNIGYFKFS